MMFRFQSCATAVLLILLARPDGLAAKEGSVFPGLLRRSDSLRGAEALELPQTYPFKDQNRSTISAGTSRNLQDEEADLEPFTLGSLQPRALNEALSAAGERVFDWATEGIVKAVGDEVPDWVKDIAIDSLEDVQETIADCIQSLGDELLESAFGSMVDSIAGLDPEVALEAVLNPAIESCSAGTASSSDSSSLLDGVLPDVSSAKDDLRGLADAVAACLADIDLTQLLGFNVQGPPARTRRRDLQDQDVCPADDPPEGGVSLAIGGSVGVNFGKVLSNKADARRQFKVRAIAGAALEAGAGFDGTPGIALALSPPLTALELTLRYSPRICEAGYFCIPGQIRVKCPPGFFCAGDKAKEDGFCAEGYFCPPGSTSKYGEPIENSSECSVGDKCFCKAGYFCPPGSTKETGNPRIDRNSPLVTLEEYGLSSLECEEGISCCEVMKQCKCPLGHFCPTGTSTVDFLFRRLRCAPLGQGNGRCTVRGCTNKDCIADIGNTRDSRLTKLLKKVKKSAKFSLGASLSFNYYWDVSAAPWNGANGLAVEINIPFPFIPSISFIFNAPPWHCPGGAEYALAGVGFGVIDLPEIQPKELKGILKRRVERFKQLRRDAGITANLKNFTKGTELRLGLAYDYTVAAAPKNFDYLWCEACESCDNCQKCVESKYEGKSATEDCKVMETGECKERRSCNPRQLRGGGLAKPVGWNSGRDLQLSTASAIEDFTSLLTSFSSTFNAELETPFCFGGDCGLPKFERDADSVIQGHLRAGSTEKCDGFEIKAQIDDHLKIKQILSVLFDDVSAFESLDSLLSIGLDGPLELALKVAGTTSLTLSARRPREDAVSSATALEDRGNILETVLNFINLLQLEVYGKVERTTLGVALESGVCVSLGKSEGQSCLDPPSQGAGTSNFGGIAIGDELLFEYIASQVGFQTPPAPGLPRSFMQISVGLNICTSMPCQKGKPELLLEGVLKGEVGGQGATIGGGLQQVGTWWGAFGCVLNCRLQVSNFLAKAQFGVKFPVPDSLELGGQICVGSRSDCEANRLDSIIKAGAFLGLDANDPSNNYVVAFLSKLTLGNSLRALGMAEFSDALPQPLRDSGILRSKGADGSTCDDSYTIPTSVEEAAVAMPPLELECFAYIVIANRPDPVEIDGITGTVNAGYSLSGRLLVDFGVELDLSVDAFFNPINGAFKIDAELFLSLPKTNPRATITGDDGVGPAKFFVEKTAGPSLGLVAKVKGKISIPDINTEGTVNIVVNSKTFMAEGSLNLFGVLQTSGAITLKPDMSYLKVQVNEFNIAGFFRFSNILFEYKELGSGDFSVELSGSFKAGNWDIFTGKIFIEVEDNVVSFKAEARLKCVVALDASGALNIGNIADSSIDNFDLGPDVACLEEAAKYVREQLYKGLDNAAAGLRDLEDDLRASCESAKSGIQSAGAAAVAGLTCTGADIAGDVASAFEAGKKLFATAKTYSGLVTEVLKEEDQSSIGGGEDIDCVMDIPLSYYNSNDPAYVEWQSRGGKWTQSCTIFADDCCDSDPFLLKKGTNFLEDVKRVDIEERINTYFDPEFKCEKKATYFCVTDPRLFGACVADNLVTRPNFDCIDDVKAYIRANQASVSEVASKEETVDDTKKRNACADEIRSQLNSASGDVFEISTFEIIRSSTESQDGQLLLMYRAKEFTNNNGVCVVSQSPINKSCTVIVPRGRSVNQFLRNQITFKFADCIGDDIIGQIDVPNTKATATATLKVSKRDVLAYCNNLDAIEDGMEDRPFLVMEDPACQTEGRAPRITFGDSEPVLVVGDPNYPCGTQSFVRTWTAFDGCGKPTNDVTQNIFIVPSSPTFEVLSLPNYQVTTSSNPNPSFKSFPKARGYCGGLVEVDFEDVGIQATTQSNGCKTWTMMRQWTAWEEIQGCTVGESIAWYGSAPLLQTVDITDDTAPELFLDFEEKRIPFFDSFQPSISVPSIRDGTAHVGYGDFVTQLVNQVTLSSDDTEVDFTTMPGAPESTCATDGLASFHRTWTVEDTCGNQIQESQKILIEHPPKTPKAPGNADSNLFLRAVGVEQLPSACAPGKQLLLGEATYSAGGAREWFLAPTPVEVLAIKPAFTFKPPNRNITTSQSPLPAAIGQAEGASFCDTPFEIVYEDSSPLLRNNECGVWTFDRTWTIRPTYQDCDDVVDDPDLIDSFVQVITVSDVAPPKFIRTPAESVAVGFLANYGPDVTGFPLVSEVVTDPDIAGLLDGIDGQPLASYPISLTYDDVVSFPDPTTTEICTAGAMAVIERTWTTIDSCGNSDTWTQTIRIDLPQQDLVGDVSAFQLATPGAMRIEHTDVAENLATGKGTEAHMRHVLLTSANRQESWTGLDPDTTKLKISGKEQRLHAPRGVIDNPSVCRNNQYNLVMEGCPKGGGAFKDVYVLGSDVTKKSKESDDEFPLFVLQSHSTSKASKGSKTSSSESSDDDDKKCGRGGSPQDGFKPVNFDAASDAIEAFSDQLANITALLTGPKLIVCNSMDQASCTVEEMSNSQQDGSVITKDEPNGGMGETIELVGNGMVYNFFTVKLEAWFFRLAKEDKHPSSSKSRSKSRRGRRLDSKSSSSDDPEPEPLWDPIVAIKSPGMVFVNVKYKTELKAIQHKSKKKMPKTGVQHDFQAYTDGEDPDAATEFYLDFPQHFGDSFGKKSSSYSHSSDSKEGRYLSSDDDKKGYSWWKNGLSETQTNLWVPRRVVFDEETLGQDHLLVNIPNPEIDNPDDVPNPKEAAGLSLSFTDTKDIKGSSVWTGTLVIGNKHTSLKLKETTWIGGQILLAGGKLELTESTVLCGRYAANVICPAA